MRKRADIVQVGSMDPIQGWIFDGVGKEVAGIEWIMEGDIYLYAGYTEDELKKICDGKAETSWADPIKCTPVAISHGEFNAESSGWRIERM